MKTGYVYITSNKNRTTLYVGVTSDLRRRVLQHRTGQSKFTRSYNVFELLYVEEVIGMRNALDRERQLKNWHRQWKINLIRSQNPEMVDLAKDWFTDEELVKGRLRARFRNRVRKGGR